MRPADAGEGLTADQIVRLEDGQVVLLDQTELPARRVERRYADWADLVEAIRAMVVRGAPAIGVAAAYGAAVAARDGRSAFEQACDGLATARPTAVNLAWAIARMREAAEGVPDDRLAVELEAASRRLHELEVERCRAIGEHGAGLIPPAGRVLTHCNAGALATGGYGTALGVIRTAHRRDPAVSVWVDETRPLLQGARLTAWELAEDGIPATLLTDSMAGWLMAEGRVDAVVVGADRIAANGDAANKIGTYTLAVLARAHRVPFIVAAPTSTIDTSAVTGADIPIEHRDPAEVLGERSAGIGAYNPAFDVTPADHITAIVTEHGVHRPPFRFA